MATLYPIVEVVDADGQPVTDDAANLTLTVVTDGTAEAYSGAVAEVADGQYKVAVTQDGTLQSVSGVSSTSGAIVVSARWYNAAPAETALDKTTWTDQKAGYLDAAISSLAGGTGAAAVTLYVKDGSSNPIAGASVTVPGAGTLGTNSLGAVVFNLDDATYTVTVRSSASYTPAASYTVVVASGAITSPAGGILTVTAISLPTPSSASCYALYDTETDEKDAPFGASGMTVTVTELSADGRVDATNNRFRSVMGRSATTDANGQWSLDIPIQAFTAGAWLTLQKSWTDAAGVAQVETWTVLLVAPTSGTQVCLSDLSCSRRS